MIRGIIVIAIIIVIGATLWMMVAPAEHTFLHT